MGTTFASNVVLTDVVVAFVLAEDAELGIVGVAEGADSGGGAPADGTGMMDGGGGCAGAANAKEASLAIILLASIDSDFITGGCDMTIGCGGGGAGVFIIGLICVDPTFIVGAFADDCCIVLIIAAVFNILAEIGIKSLKCSSSFQ